MSAVYHKHYFNQVQLESGKMILKNSMFSIQIWVIKPVYETSCCILPYYIVLLLTEYCLNDFRVDF